MANKNIAVFAPNLSGGGAERIIAILATGLSKRNYVVDLLLGKAIGPYLRDIPSSVNVVGFDCEKVLFTLPHLVSYLRKRKPDVLFASQMHSSTLALWAVKIAGVGTKVIIRQPTMLQPAFGRRTPGAALRQRLLLCSANKWAHKVVVTSKDMADEFSALSKVSADNIAVIHNPLPIAKIHLKSQQSLDHSWFEEGQPPVVLAVGRLVRVKDFHTLIEAFSLVRTEFDVRLMILGEGPLRAELEQLLKKLNLENDVQMLGFVENPFQYMKRSKVFVMSSLWEGFPNGMIEAMACGANVVATDCDGGTAEILGYGKWGKLVPVQNTKRMAASIHNVLLSTDLPNTKERAEHFDLDTIVDEYTQLFEC